MTAVSEESEHSSWAYRPHLDGLRAVAVYLVVGFHAGLYRMAGGFIGVDVFFVLSGYLVTTILLRDLEQTGGRIRLARFYARRARRLLPAAAVTLLATAVVFASIGGAAEVVDVRAAIRAASLYVANWHFVRQSADYFAADVDANPVLHFWSLAVEEQFYLLWPLVLWGLHRLSLRAGTRWRTVLRAFVAALALASAVAALRISDVDLNRAYYGTDTRAYQLLAGALLALTPGLATRLRGLQLGGARLERTLPWWSLALLASLAVLATPSVTVDPVERGLLVTVVTVALLLSLEAANGGVGRWVLSLPPLVYLGKISYGTYLWHWLVIVVLSHETDLGSRAIFAVTVPVATGLASLSHQVLETPIRSNAILDRLRGPTLASGLAISLLVGLVAAPAMLAEGRPPAVELEADAMAVAATNSVDRAKVVDAFFDVFDYDACPSSVPTACTFTTGTGQTAIVVGESHAATYARMLTELAERHEMTLYGGLLSFCPWTRGIQYAGVAADCLSAQDRMFDEIIPALDPDVVFLAHRPVDDPNQPMEMSDADIGRVKGAERDRALARRIEDVVEDLVADGRKVVIFEPIPIAPADEDPFYCLDKTEVIAGCRFITSEDPVPEDLELRAMDERFDSVTSIDLDLATCPYRPICDPIVGGEIVRRDNNHLTIEYAASLVDLVEERLEVEGVL